MFSVGVIPCDRPYQRMGYSAISRDYSDNPDVTYRCNFLLYSIILIQQSNYLQLLFSSNQRILA